MKLVSLLSVRSLTSFLSMQMLKECPRSTILVRFLEVTNMNHGTHKLVGCTIQVAANLNVAYVGRIVDLFGLALLICDRHPSCVVISQCLQGTEVSSLLLRLAGCHHLGGPMQRAVPLILPQMHMQAAKLGSSHADIRPEALVEGRESEPTLDKLA